MRISDWSSDVCSSDLVAAIRWTYQHGGEQFRPGLAPALAFAAPLFALLPTLEAHLKAAPSPGELLMQAAMAWQAVARHPGALAKAVPAGDGQAVDIVCAYQEVEIGLAAMETALALLRALSEPGAGRGRSLAAAMARFHARIEQRCLDQTTRAIVQAAEARGIPWFRMHPALRKIGRAACRESVCQYGVHSGVA